MTSEKPVKQRNAMMIDIMIILVMIAMVIIGAAYILNTSAMIKDPVFYMGTQHI